MSEYLIGRVLQSILLALLFSLFSFNGYTSEKLIIDGSTGVKPLVESLIRSYKQIEPAIVIEMGNGLNPQSRIQAMVDKKIDIAMASHGVDIQHISQLGLKVHRIAKMAVVIGVNHTVSLSTVSDRQLCDIYDGKLNNWRHLGGPELTIVPMLRPFNEVDTEVVSAHISCFSQIDLPPDIQTYKKSGQMARTIMQTSGALGMTTLVRVAQSNGKMRALSINGMSPNSKNLLSGAYPLTRDSFLITSSEPNEEVTAFLAFIRSEQGSDVILANSAVPAR